MCGFGKSGHVHRTRVDKLNWLLLGEEEMTEEICAVFREHSEEFCGKHDLIVNKKKGE